MKVESITPRFKKFFKDWGVDKEYEWIPNQSPNKKLAKRVMKVMYQPEVLAEINKHYEGLYAGMSPENLHPTLKRALYDMVMLIEKEKWKIKKSNDKKLKTLYEELTTDQLTNKDK